MTRLDCSVYESVDQAVPKSPIPSLKKKQAEIKHHITRLICHMLILLDDAHSKLVTTNNQLLSPINWTLDILNLNN
jgi:hypothetical protein